jgi:hypothetical protein
VSLKKATEKGCFAMSSPRCLASRVTGLAAFRTLGDCLLWSVFEKSQKWLKIFCHFFHGKLSILILTKNGLGYILGDFFANSSGHSVVKRLCLHRKICFESV